MIKVVVANLVIGFFCQRVVAPRREGLSID